MTAPAPVRLRVPLAAFVLGATQCREETDEELVKEYALARREGVELPAPDVFARLIEGALPEGAKVWIGDGEHRVRSAMYNGVAQDIECYVHEGGEEEAFRFALRANRNHGKRLTNADKRHAVRRALERWPNLSDRQIAKLADVGYTLVADVRKKLEEEQGTARDGQLRTGADGKARRLPGAAPEQPEEDPRQVGLFPVGLGGAGPMPPPPAEPPPTYAPVLPGPAGEALAGLPLQPERKASPAAQTLVQDEAPAEPAPADPPGFAALLDEARQVGAEDAADGEELRENGADVIEDMDGCEALTPALSMAVAQSPKLRQRVLGAYVAGFSSSNEAPKQATAEDDDAPATTRAAAAKPGDPYEVGERIALLRTAAPLRNVPEAERPAVAAALVDLALQFDPAGPSPRSAGVPPGAPYQIGEAGYYIAWYVQRTEPEAHQALAAKLRTLAATLDSSATGRTDAEQEIIEQEHEEARRLRARVQELEAQIDLADKVGAEEAARRGFEQGERETLERVGRWLGIEELPEDLEDAAIKLEERCDVLLLAERAAREYPEDKAALLRRVGAAEEEAAKARELLALAPVIADPEEALRLRDDAQDVRAMRVRQRDLERKLTDAELEVERLREGGAGDPVLAVACPQCQALPGKPCDTCGLRKVAARKAAEAAQREEPAPAQKTRHAGLLVQAEKLTVIVWGTEYVRRDDAQAALDAAAEQAGALVVNRTSVRGTKADGVECYSGSIILAAFPERAAAMQRAAAAARAELEREGYVLKEQPAPVAENPAPAPEVLSGDETAEAPASAEERPAKADPLALACGRCGVVAGQPCKNYRGHKKPPCRDRGAPIKLDEDNEPQGELTLEREEPAAAPKKRRGRKSC